MSDEHCLVSGILEDALPDCVGDEVVLGDIELMFPLRMSPHAVVLAAGLACRSPTERLQPFLEICTAHCETSVQRSLYRSKRERPGRAQCRRLACRAAPRSRTRKSGMLVPRRDGARTRLC